MSPPAKDWDPPTTEKPEATKKGIQHQPQSSNLKDAPRQKPSHPRAVRRRVQTERLATQTSGGREQDSDMKGLTRPRRAATDMAQYDSDSSSTSYSDDTLYQRNKSNLRSREKASNLAGRRGSNSNKYSRFSFGNDHYRSKGNVSRKDGRLNITVNEMANSGYIAKALGATIRRQLAPKNDDGVVAENRDKAGARVASDLTGSPRPVESEYDRQQVPKLNIVVMVIGSRGDIQPFIKIAKILKDKHGHRVRLATHPAFKEFIEEKGLEFFSVGGDPSELMAFMVKNPGLIPSMDTVRKGEIGRRRAQMSEMFEGMWRACVKATDDEKDPDDEKINQRSPFVADAIIANPPSFAHVHCAERLGVPLHMMFTFPYTPTEQFPHPLANIKAGNVDKNYTNFMSYPLVEMMTWQGLGDLVNNFRTRTLGLDPVSTLWAPGQSFRLKVPHTYLWSPSLVPKPPDWGPEIDIAGFVFLDLASSFEPPEDLTKFLESGPTPIYIGFGSIVVDNADKFTSLIFKAVEMAGVRALVSKGWGGLGEDNVPDNIYMLENTPHDWLFPRISAVVHHGGAGTNAIGLKCGKPTMIVPFFGDQPFWGAMVAKARAGAHECIPYKKLTAEKLAEGIKQCLTDEAKENARRIAEGISKEGDGAENAVKSFHRSLPLRGERSMRCSFLSEFVAVWTLKNTSLRLSALAAELLVQQGKIKRKRLRLLRHYDWNDFDGPGEPFTGGSAAVVSTLSEFGKGVAGVPFKITKDVRKREKHKAKKQKIRRSMESRQSKSVERNSKGISNARTENEQKSQESSRKDGEHKTRTEGEYTRSEANADLPSNKQDSETESAAQSYGQKSDEDGQQRHHRDAESEKAGIANVPNTESEHHEQHASPALPAMSHTGETAARLRSLIKTDATTHDAGDADSRQNEEVDTDHDDQDSEEGDQPEESSPQHETNRQGTGFSTLSADPERRTAHEGLRETRKGVRRAGGALVRLPMDLSLSVAQGFHNAPRLYGDNTVRRPNRISGFHSGVRAAGNEFRYGVQDGFTGLFSQPYHGAKEGGFVGCATGFGKGLGGFVLKNIAAVIGPGGYTMKGLQKEWNKKKSPIALIVRARTVQGERELSSLAQDDRSNITVSLEKGWATMNEVWHEKDRLKKSRHGIVRGRLAVRREAKDWSEHAAFENVDQTGKALDAKKKGFSLDTVLGRHKREVDMAQAPRESAMKEDGKNDRDEERDGDGGRAIGGHRAQERPTKGGGGDANAAAVGRTVQPRDVSKMDIDALKAAVDTDGPAEGHVKV